MSRKSELERSSGQPRVLLVGNYSPDAGFAWWLMENFWVQFTEVARARGFEPLLVYPHEGPIPESIREADIPTLTLRFPGRGPRELWRAVRLIRSRRVRCIYLTDRDFWRPAYGLLRAAGARVIVNHDHTPGDRPPIRGVGGLVKAVLRRFRPATCDLQICVSPLIRERAIHNARIPSGRVVVVQNGIEPVECDGDRSYAHRAFGLPDDATICISAGRAHRYKRIDFMIEVARLCVVEHGLDDLFFLFCGDGPDMQRLQGLARDAGLEDRFLFGGYREDVPRLLCSADMAIHPSKGEAFSLAIVEYMSAGLPVVVPDLPSVSQAIQDGLTGLVYPDGHAEEAARGIIRLARDRAMRERLGKAASADARSRYSLESMNQRFRDVVGGVLDSI